MGPRSVSGGGVDVSGASNVDKFAAPGGGEGLGAMQGHIRIVGARDDYGGKRQAAHGHGSEPLGARRVGGSFDITRCDEESGVDTPVVREFCRPVRNGSAGETVRGKNEGASSGGERIVESLDPVGTARVVPVFLRYTAEIRMACFPDALPVLGSGIIEPRDN